MTVGIHQPNFFPWIGYFFKASRCDTFVFLDDVEFSKNNFINRVRLIANDGVFWWSLPTRVKGRSEQLISETELVEIEKWKRKSLKRLELAYKKAPYFEDVFPLVEQVLKVESQKMMDFTLKSILQLFEVLEIKSSIKYSSDIATGASKDDRLIEIVKAVGGKTYLSGKGGQSYMNLSLYESEGIKVEFLGASPSPYPQLHTNEFVPGLSTLDLLFNLGLDGARAYFADMQGG